MFCLIDKVDEESCVTKKQVVFGNYQSLSSTSP